MRSHKNIAVGLVCLSIASCAASSQTHAASATTRPTEKAISIAKVHPVSFNGPETVEGLDVGTEKSAASPHSSLVRVANPDVLASKVNLWAVEEQRKLSRPSAREYLTMSPGVCGASGTIVCFAVDSTQHVRGKKAVSTQIWYLDMSDKSVRQSQDLLTQSGKNKVVHALDSLSPDTSVSMSIKRVLKPNSDSPTATPTSDSTPAATQSASASSTSAPAPSASSAPTAESPVPRRAAEADREAPAQAGAPQRPARAGTGSAADAEMIRDRWEEVLEAAKRSRRATWALVGPNSQPGGINGGVFEVIFTGQGLVNAFENGGHGPVLSRALHQALGLRLEAHAVLGGPSGGGRDGGPGGPHGGRGPVGWPDDAGSDGHRSSPDGVAGGGGRPESSGGRFGESVRGGAPAGTASEASANGGTPPSADEIVPPESEDDGWGVIAVPGAARAARESAADSAAPAPAGRSVDSADAPGPPGPSAPGSAPAPPVPSPAAAPAPMASAAASAPSPSASPVPSAGPVDGAEPVCPERAGGEPPLATVHRLRALPDLPGGASSSSATPEAASADRSGLPDRPDRHGLDPVSWDSPDTFSDGTPVPQEPPPEDEDDPEDSWAPSGAVHDRLSAARAAARAAAGGHSAQSAGRAAGAAFSPLEDDVPSEDDEDAEEAGIVGLEVVKRLLGATVLEEITVTQEGR